MYRKCLETHCIELSCSLLLLCVHISCDVVSHAKISILILWSALPYSHHFLFRNFIAYKCFFVPFFISGKLFSLYLPASQFYRFAFYIVVRVFISRWTLFVCVSFLLNSTHWHAHFSQSFSMPVLGSSFERFASFHFCCVSNWILLLWWARYWWCIDGCQTLFNLVLSFCYPCVLYTWYSYFFPSPFPLPSPNTHAHTQTWKPSPLLSFFLRLLPFAVCYQNLFVGQF